MITPARAVVVERSTATTISLASHVAAARAMAMTCRDMNAAAAKAMGIAMAMADAVATKPVHHPFWQAAHARFA